MRAIHPLKKKNNQIVNLKGHFGYYGKTRHGLTGAKGLQLPMLKLIKLANKNKTNDLIRWWVSCMRQITLTLSRAPGDCID